MVATAFPQSSSAPAGWLTQDELRKRYGAYRRRQAARLVQMLPKEAIRPLYRRARAAALRAGVSSGELGGDPLALLVGFCETLLPLPPFATWCADLESHPDAHFADMEESVDGPTAEAPSTMDAREVRYGGRPWMARLRSFRDADLWRGYIAFEERGSGQVHRTATVFCEHRAHDLRERFASFDSSALEAFLRSALP